MPWYTQVRRWGQTNLTENDPPRIDMDFWKDYWKRMRIGGVIVNAGGIVAYYPSEFPLHYRAASLGSDDLFGRFTAAAREAGLAVVARMDCNRATPEFYKAHPEWFCVDQNGVPYQSQGRYFSCVNTDYYKTYIPSVLREIIRKYHPDGFSDNSWSGMNKDHICYCERCKTLFRERTGHELPKAVDWNDPIFREYVRWGYECREANWRLFNEVTREEGGEDCLWVGMIHADPHISGNHYVDLRRFCSSMPIVFTDHQSRSELDGFEQNYVNGALLHMLSGENSLVPESLAHYTRGARTFRLGAMPAAEVQAWMTSGIAGGISPWYHHVSGGTEDRRQFKASESVMQWHADNEAYLYNRTNLANVALVWSQQNADFYGRGHNRERVALPWRGFTVALRDSRTPFIPLHIDDLPREMDRFRVLVLPDVAALSDAEIASVCTFLKRGGSIVMTGASALLDQDGESRARSELWELLGLSPLTESRETAEISERDDWEICRNHTYLALEKERHPLWNGFEDTDIIGFGGKLTAVASSGPLQPVGGVIPAFPIYPPEFSAIAKPDFTRAPLYAGQLPWGGRVVYFAADIDRCCGAYRLPDHIRILSNAIDWALGGDRLVEVSGAGMLMTSLYAQEQRRILHLVNLSGRDALPGLLSECLPAHGITVSFPADRPVRVRRLVAPAELPVVQSGGKASVTLDEIGVHEVLVIEAE